MGKAASAGLDTPSFAGEVGVFAETAGQAHRAARMFVYDSGRAETARLLEGR